MPIAAGEVAEPTLCHREREIPFQIGLLLSRLMAELTPTADRGQRISRVLGLSLTLVTLCTAVTLALLLILFSKDPYNEERIIPTVALATGVKIYQVQGSGPHLSVLYGPFFYLLYWPLTWCRHAAPLLSFGTLWSLFLYSLPAWCLAFSGRRMTALQRWIPVLTLLVLSLSSYWSTQVMLAIHPDAAGCGLAGLGFCLIALAERIGPARIGLAVLLCTAAFFCKQNLGFALPLLCVLIWMRAGRKRCGLALLFAVISACGLLVLFWASYGDLRSIWFNNYVVPRRSGLEWRKASAGLLTFYQSILMHLLFLAILLSTELRRGSAIWNRRTALYLFALAASAMLLSFPAYLFPGGAGNAFAPAMSMLSLTCSLWIWRLLLDRTGRDLWLTAIGPAAFLLVVAVSTFSLRVRTPEIASALRKSPSERVEQYDRAHPGQVYFPFNPVAVYFAEGRFYNTDWGMENRARAGFATPEAEFREGAPRAARLLAYPIAPTSGPGYILQKYFPAAAQIQQAKLEDFFVYSLR